MGKGRSHAGKSGVRGTAIAKKALRERQKVKVKEKAKVKVKEKTKVKVKEKAKGESEKGFGKRKLI